MDWKDLEDLEHPVKLNLGGKRYYHGRRGWNHWVSVDARRLPHWYAIHHIFPHNMPIPDNSVDAIMTEHFLEHISHKAVEITMQECVRVLKKGARCRIAVPDLNHPAMTHARITGEDPSRHHQSVWGRKEMQDVMMQAGFSEVLPLSYWVHSGSPESKDCTHHHEDNIDWSHGLIKRTKEHDRRNRVENEYGNLRVTSLILDGIK